jgi:hypothetical protein
VGAISINEIREKEDLPPVDGGDEYFVPLNMTPLKRALEDKDENNTDGIDGSDIPAIGESQGDDNPGATNIKQGQVANVDPANAKGNGRYQ